MMFVAFKISCHKMTLRKILRNFYFKITVHFKWIFFINNFVTQVWQFQNVIAIIDSVDATEMF